MIDNVSLLPVILAVLVVAASAWLVQKLLQSDSQAIADPPLKASRTAPAGPSGAYAAAAVGEEEKKMSDDDLFDAAFNELGDDDDDEGDGGLDEAAEDLLLAEALNESSKEKLKTLSGAETKTVKKPVVVNANAATMKKKTWLEELQVLEPAERLEWAKKINKDMSLQLQFQPQPNLSWAYQRGAGDTSEADSSGDGAGIGKRSVGNAFEGLMKGKAVLTPESSSDLLAVCLKKAILSVNKEYVGDYRPGDEILKAFKAQLKEDVRDRIENHDVEHANVALESDRFPNLDSLIES